MRGWRKQVSVLWMSDGLPETKHYSTTVADFKFSLPVFGLPVTPSNEKLQHSDLLNTYI